MNEKFNASLQRRVKFRNVLCWLKTCRFAFFRYSRVARTATPAQSTFRGKAINRTNFDICNGWPGCWNWTPLRKQTQSEMRILFFQLFSRPYQMHDSCILHSSLGSRLSWPIPERLLYYYPPPPIAGGNKYITRVEINSPRLLFFEKPTHGIHIRGPRLLFFDPRVSRKLRNIIKNRKFLLYCSDMSTFFISKPEPSSQLKMMVNLSLVLFIITIIILL